MDIEQHIRAVGADQHPRITVADIEAEIEHEVYFNAADGLRLAYLTEDIRDHHRREQRNSIIDSMPVRSYSGVCLDIEANTPIPGPLKLLTFCVLVLRNGFTVTGESACASPANFNAQIGQRAARDAAINKAWQLLGFRLRDKLHAVETAIPPDSTD